MDHHYDENENCFHLEKLLGGSSQHTVIFDHVLQHDEFLKDPIYCPAFLSREVEEFLSQQISINWTNKTYAFNFMINKQRPHRLLMLNLIHELGLTNFCHSLCWQSSGWESIPVTDYRLGQEKILDRAYVTFDYLNAHTYQHLLKNRVFEPSWVSLITEPVYIEKETIVTEKTIMAIYGGTIPIWVGGWRIPDYMSSLGFDIFQDLVNHDYQSLADPVERCRRALIDNIDLLTTPIESVDIKRLQYNFDLLNSNPWKIQVTRAIDKYPEIWEILK
jgi:hypothetical protein